MSPQKHYCTLLCVACLSFDAAVVRAESAPADSTSADSSQDVLQEIKITATRQERPLSKVPLSVVAADQQTLDKEGVHTAADLMRLTPSVTFGQDNQFYGTGQTNISIRGIQSSSGIPTTGVYIDDTPIQTRTGISPSLTNAYPQIFDLDRVEVLRGPQGTLFGTGSMGGAVRFITPEPNMRTAALYTRSEVGSTEHGGISYEQGVAGGAPIVEDTLGFRASFWHRYDAGYIDRLDRVTKQLAQKDINGQHSNAGRIALGWKALSNLVITPSLFFQQTTADDGDLFEVATSDPAHEEFRTSLYKIPQSHLDRFFLPALKVTLDAGPVTLISNTSYLSRKTNTKSDDSSLNLAIWGAYTGPFPAPGLPPDNAETNNTTTQTGLTEEIRLQSSDPSSRLNWVVGAFFSHSITRDAFDAANPNILSEINYAQAQAGLPPVASVADFLGVGLYQGMYVVSQRSGYYDLQRSVFAQADYEIVPRLKLTAGLRYTSADFTYQNFVAGPLYASNGIASTLQSSSHPVTPKYGVSFQATDNNLFYASAAKGVRGSGVADAVGDRCTQDGAAIGFDPLVSRSIRPDSVWSYEVGSKNRLAGGRLGIEASAYHVKWTDVQTTLVLPVCQVNTTLNLGNAQVDGFDLSLAAQATSSLSLSAAVSYMDAKYSTSLPGPNDTIIRRKGEPLAVAPWSMHLSGEYVFAVHEHDLYVRSDYTHTTHNSTPVDTNSPLVDPAIARSPATSDLDLRAGARFGGLDISLFAGNVLNNHPLLSLGHDTVGDVNYRSTTFRPRTVGITATFRK